MKREEKEKPLKDRFWKNPEEIEPGLFFFPKRETAVSPDAWLGGPDTSQLQPDNYRHKPKPIDLVGL